MSSSVEVNLSEEVHAPLNSTLNATRKLEYMKMLLWQYENNRAISTTWHYVFLVGYILIGLVALLANGLVVLAMYRNKHVRTPRNLLIFNLALTDLALAATIPLSTMDALSKYWPWGNQTNWLCKISKSVPTTLVFMGSVIIVVIAVDRYRCIVMRNSRQMTQALSLFVLPISLGIASTVSFPLMIHSQLVQPQISVTSSPQLEIVFCMEQWVKTEKIDDKNISFRGIYSVTVVVLQYLLPLLIVLLIYGMIYKFVREQRYPRHLRQNKTNFLLMIISLTHCIIWLPFSVFNILADLWPDEFFQSNPESMITIYCATHLIGMSSTCTNPILYGFFNDNIRREFEFLVNFVKLNFQQCSQDTIQNSLANKRSSTAGGHHIENNVAQGRGRRLLLRQCTTETVISLHENPIIEANRDQLRPKIRNWKKKNSYPNSDSENIIHKEEKGQEQGSDCYQQNNSSEDNPDYLETEF